MLRTSSVSGEGIGELWEAIQRHRRHQESSGELHAKRTRRILEEVQQMVALRLRSRTARLLADPDHLALANDLVERRVDPYAAAEILLRSVTARGEASTGGG